MIVPPRWGRPPFARWHDHPPRREGDGRVGVQGAPAPLLRSVLYHCGGARTAMLSRTTTSLLEDLGDPAKGPRTSTQYTMVEAATNDALNNTTT